MENLTKEEIERHLMMHKMRHLSLLDTKNKMYQYGGENLDFESIDIKIADEKEQIIKYTKMLNE